MFYMKEYILMENKEQFKIQNQEDNADLESIANIERQKKRRVRI